MERFRVRAIAATFIYWCASLVDRRCYVGRCGKTLWQGHQNRGSCQISQADCTRKVTGNRLTENQLDCVPCQSEQKDSHAIAPAVRVTNGDQQQAQHSHNDASNLPKRIEIGYVERDGWAL